MDMRTFGKDYELYLERAKTDYGVRFLRSRPHSILQPHGSDTLNITYTNDDSTEQHIEDFDMVVLSTGFKTSEESQQLALNAGIELNDSHFPITDGFNPVATTKPGIYVAGTFESPKDIPDTMVQASAAACMAGGDLPAVKTPGSNKRAASLNTACLFGARLNTPLLITASKLSSSHSVA